MRFNRTCASEEIRCLNWIFKSNALDRSAITPVVVELMTNNLFFEYTKHFMENEALLSSNEVRRGTIVDSLVASLDGKLGRKKPSAVKSV